MYMCKHFGLPNTLKRFNVHGLRNDQFSKQGLLHVITQNRSQKVKSHRSVLEDPKRKELGVYKITHLFGAESGTDGFTYQQNDINGSIKMHGNTGGLDNSKQSKSIVVFGVDRYKLK